MLVAVLAQVVVAPSEFVVVVLVAMAVMTMEMKMDMVVVNLVVVAMAVAVAVEMEVVVMAMGVYPVMITDDISGVAMEGNGGSRDSHHPSLSLSSNC